MLRPFCLLPVLLLLVLAIPDGHAQKRNKKRQARHSAQAQSETASKPGVDMSSKPASVPIPQEHTLRPKLKKTKKVVIVPAPPPPPGPDPVPPYPKR